MRRAQKRREPLAGGSSSLSKYHDTADTRPISPSAQCPAIERALVQAGKALAAWLFCIGARFHEPPRRSNATMSGGRRDRSA
jgi:hypothetical protein